MSGPPQYSPECPSLAGWTALLVEHSCPPTPPVHPPVHHHQHAPSHQQMMDADAVSISLGAVSE